MVTHMHIANTLINILQHHKHTCQRKAYIFLEISPAESMQLLQKLEHFKLLSTVIFIQKKNPQKRISQKIMIIRTDCSDRKPSHSRCFYHQKQIPKL